ncbi:MAG: putative selenoprotein, partial [Nitrosospira sp.]|nr:putative selenoprotein [Nitrosospira sp.]
MSERLKNSLRWFWQLLRAVSGDRAYHDYLQHWRRNHTEDGAAPLSQRDFYLSEQQRKWNRPNR